MLTLSTGNNAEFVYHKNYDTHKYEVIGLRVYEYEIDEEDNTCLVKIEDLDDLILSIQKLKKDLREYNNLGS